VPRFFRLVPHDPPIVDDFRSHAELGKGRPRTVSQQDWEGVSVLDTLHAAADLRESVLSETGRDLGQYVAELDVPQDLKTRQQGPNPNHYLIWAAADQLFGYVVGPVTVLPLGPQGPAGPPGPAAPV
jgi:hypothetical protein